MLRTSALLIVSVIGIIGCSGGGGSDECKDSVRCIGPDPATIVESSDVLGMYDIQYNLSSNTCTGSAPLKLLHEQYNATSGFGYHGYPTIEVSSSTGAAFSAYSSVENTDGKTYFSNANEFGVRELTNFISGMTCSEYVTLSFFDIGNSKATVVRTSDISCLKSSDGSALSCQVIYNGQGNFSS